MFTDCLFGVSHHREAKKCLNSKQKAWVRDLKIYRIVLFEMLKDKGHRYGF